MRMRVREAKPGDEVRLVELIAGFRVALAEVRGVDRSLDLETAREELAEYRGKGYPIFVAVSDDGDLLGYLVCRIDGQVVWAESLYVDPEWRRQGVGTSLYENAEELAQELGGEWPYNWVDPENEAIIRFLGARGYDVLNLVELRRARKGESNLREIQVGGHRFRR